MKKDLEGSLVTRPRSPSLRTVYTTHTHAHTHVRDPPTRVKGHTDTHTHTGAHKCLVVRNGAEDRVRTQRSVPQGQGGQGRDVTCDPWSCSPHAAVRHRKGVGGARVRRDLPLGSKGADGARERRDLPLGSGESGKGRRLPRSRPAGRLLRRGISVQTRPNVPS